MRHHIQSTFNIEAHGKTAIYHLSVIHMHTSVQAAPFPAQRTAIQPQLVMLVPQCSV